MIFKPILAVIFAALVALAAHAAPAPITWTFDAEKNLVTFHGRANLFSIEGESSKLDGSLVQNGDKVTGILTVDLRPFRTDNELRDSHMHQKYLQTSKYPRAELALKEVPIKLGDSVAWCGKLRVKEDVQDVCGTYQLSSTTLEATFDLDLKKIPSLGIPAWAGATMSDTVTVSVKAAVKRS